MKQYYKDWQRAARRYLSSNKLVEPPEPLTTQDTLGLISRVVELEAAMKKFVRAYGDRKALRLGNGQARRSYNEFQKLLSNDEQGDGESADS